MQTALLFSSVLLLAGFALRAKVKLLQAFFIPAAVVAGIFGFAIVNITTPLEFTTTDIYKGELNDRKIPETLRQAFEAHGLALSPDATVLVDTPDKQWHLIDGQTQYAIEKTKTTLDVHMLRLNWNGQAVVRNLQAWPGLLIAVIFSGLLLDRPNKSFRHSIKPAAREGIVVWIIILGEVTVGLIAAWLTVKGLGVNVPKSFGQLIETGFAGGHGTAAAMGEIFETMGFPQGRDLGFLFATCGLVIGVITGIVYINIGVRRGWTRGGKVKINLLTGLESRSEPQPIAFGKVRSEVMEPLVFQILIIALAFGIGAGLHEVTSRLFPQTSRFPLFLYTLLGGLLVREGMRHLRLDDLIDVPSIHRIIGTAMEFLIVAAITSMKLSALVEFGWPVFCLLVVAFCWTGFCLLVIARHLLPKSYWFELGILNYGMSTGTTAQGMMLLRIIDKNLESGAAEDYALASPLSAPFIGGGVITLIAMPWMLDQFPMGLVIGGLIAFIAILYGLGIYLSRPERVGSRNE